MIRWPIYLDHHATTPVDDEVLDAMIPFLKGSFGNPASKVHDHGRVAANAVAEGRSRVASLIGARTEEIVFTSGATEANGLALIGALTWADGGHVITQVTEHPAVLDTLSALENDGVAVTRLAVDTEGRLNPEDVRAALRDDTRLISVMRCNNEIGTVQDVSRIGEIAREAGVLMHCDAAQGLGLLPLNVAVDAVDLVSMSAHKIYGPKGVGALYVRRGVGARMNPVIFGGGQEGGLRSGTLNVPGIVGFGHAARLLTRYGSADRDRMTALRDRLHKKLSVIDETRLFGPPLGEERHPGNLNMGFDCTESAGLLLALAPRMSVSSGAACSTTKTEPSHVLLSIGATEEQARSSIRFGIGRSTTAAEVDAVAEAVRDNVADLRTKSPLWRQRGKALAW